MEGKNRTHHITRLLEQGREGSQGALDELVQLVYEQLEKIARSQLLGERKNHTLQPSDLVHEAWLRLVTPLEEHEWPSRQFFYRAAAEAMRRVLIDYARRRGRVKRGGGGHKITANILDLVARDDSPEFLDVEEAVRRLEEKEERLGRVVRLRFYAGLSVAETSEALGVSEGTVRRDWTFARAWLYKVLEADS